MPQSANPEAGTIGSRIRRYRRDKDMSINQLATRSGVSKGYISSLETADDDNKQRPSGETLYKIAEALGVNMSDLLGRKLIMQPPDSDEIDLALQQFADDEGLTTADVRMLASIEWRGEKPQTSERWKYIYQAITTSTALDKDQR